MRFYTYGGSANSYKAELLLALTNATGSAGARRDVERIEVSIFEGASRTPEFLRRNPAGRIPVLELDDGTFLPESNAILWHLARGTAFFPRGAAAEDRALAWLFYEQYEIEPVIGSARFWILTGRVQERGEAELKKKQALGQTALETLARELTPRPFLQGDAPTVADLAIYAFVHLAPDAGLPLPAEVAAWCRRIEALPGYVEGPAAYDAHAIVK
jgi:glutathione S-transferase